MVTIHLPISRTLLLAGLLVSAVHAAVAQTASQDNPVAQQSPKGKVQPPTGARSQAAAKAASSLAARVRAMSATEALTQLGAPSVQVEALSMQTLVARLRQTNRSILSKQAEAVIAATGIERAEAAFQPQITASAVRGSTLQKNTFEEELIRQNLGIYDREGSDFSVGLSTVVPVSGAKIELKSSLSRFITNNNRNDPLRPAEAYDNRSALSLSLTQPLARDAGPEVTQARVNIARLDTSMAELASRDTETSAVAEAMLLYHELVFAQQKVSAAEEKIRTSTSLLAEANALRRQGRLAQSEVWEVENALARYRSALSEAIQYQRERSNRLRAMLMMEPSPVLLKAADELPAVETTGVDAGESLRLALARRDDYLMRKVQVEREGVQLVYAQNQKMPRIDFVASYGLNGLEYSGRQAVNLQNMRPYPGWTVGIQANVPLGRNKQADADLQAAVIRRQDALLALKALETQIASDIDTSLALLASMSERWNLWREVAARETEQLTAERAKFAAGRSDTRELLLRQERVINARLSVQEQQVGFARAQTLLQAAQGVLMERFP